MKINQLGINSVSLRAATLVEVLDACAEAGFRQVEFPLSAVKEYLQAGNSPADLRRLLDERGLRCIGGFEVPLQVFASPEQCTANWQLHIDNSKLLAEIGGTHLIVGTDGPPKITSVDDPMGMVAAALAAVCQRAAPLGVTLLIEFNWSPLVKSFRTAVEIARRTGMANAGVVFDPAHYHCTPSKFEQITPESVAFIKHVHVNNMRNNPGELSNCNSDRVLPGDPQGCLDLAALFGALERCGYGGSFSIEMFSDELWALPAREAARRMYASLLTLCDAE